jgi:hypothetical protein
MAAERMNRTSLLMPKIVKFALACLLCIGVISGIVLLVERLH